jgi:hypothetical protein
MATSKKCGNPACSCTPSDKEKFCSPHCEAMKSSVEFLCGCVHAQCTGTASSVEPRGESPGAGVAGKY